MSEKSDVWQGTLALMVLKTLETMGRLHGYGIARRIEQTSEDVLSVNYGTLYPALLRIFCVDTCRTMFASTTRITFSVAASNIKVLAWI